MEKVGYARTSTIDQKAGLEAQQRDLKLAGCVQIFSEHVSAVKVRDGLDKALQYVRKGDTFIVTKIDRLARSVPDLLRIADFLKDKGVNLVILDMQMDTSTPQGQMMMTVFGAVAQFERAIMLERQKEGIIKAKADGKFKGRKPLPDEVKNTVLAFVQTGASKAWIAKKVGIGEASVYRIINEDKNKAPA
jgi:DNA invertase Pin-like site-specific DNA recombinase